VSLDLTTGELHLDGPDAPIGPLTRVEDLETRSAPAFVPFTEHGGHTSYMAEATIDGTPFSVVMWFHDARLQRISLTVDDPAISGTSWNDYDPEQVRAVHDRWVAEHVGETTAWHPDAHPYGGIERSFDWGTVGSYLHPQDSAATITISYTEGASAMDGAR
jgi:hypothetical protein